MRNPACVVHAAFPVQSQRSKPYVECWKANAIDFFLQK